MCTPTNRHGHPTATHPHRPQPRAGGLGEQQRRQHGATGTCRISGTEGITEEALSTGSEGLCAECGRHGEQGARRVIEAEGLCCIVCRICVVCVQWPHREGGGGVQPRWRQGVQMPVRMRCSVTHPTATHPAPTAHSGLQGVRKSGAALGQHRHPHAATPTHPSPPLLADCLTSCWHRKRRLKPPW